MEDFDYLNCEFEDFKAGMEKVTAILNQMNYNMQHMRWQFGDPEYYNQFVEAINGAQGWIHSHC